MKILNGSELAGFIKERQLKQVRNLRQSWRVVPRLAVVQAKDDPVIDTYVRLKRKYAEDILIEFELHKVDEATIARTIGDLNARDDVHGIIVQLPVVDGINTEEILTRVASDKDVDALGGTDKFIAATPVAIDWLLAGYNIDLQDADIAIVGQGKLVGAPLARLWSDNGYRVTTYSKGDDLSRLTGHDVIVTATGVPNLITSEVVAQGAILVDAGVAEQSGVMRGDVAEDVRSRRDITITPTIGGVGPLTVAALYDNVITSARRVAEQKGQQDLV